MAGSTRHGRQPANPTPRRPQPPLPRRPQPRHTNVRRTKAERRGLPWPIRALLAASLLSLCASVAFASTGALDGVAGRLGSAVGGLLDDVLGAGVGPSPSTETSGLEPPTLRPPSNPYTNKPAMDIVGHLPSGVAGRRGMTIRIYVDGELTDQAAVARTADFAVDEVPLPRGWSDVTATLVGPDGLESTHSEAIAVCFDDEVPPLQIVAPTDGQALNGETIAVRGTTQGGSKITIRNENTGAQTQGRAAEEGNFEVEVPLGKGRNGLTVTVQDPAGNSESAVVSVVRGDGELTAELSLSESRIKLSSLPAELTISLNVLDPDGVPVEGAKVTFTISPPGLPTETFEAVTAQGVASWADVTIPREGATAGSGFVTVTIVLPNGKVVEQTAAFTIY